jgi:acylphosphatase
MAKQSIKETIKETHKLAIEGVFEINPDGKILITVDGDTDDKKILSNLMINFNGKFCKLSIQEDSEEEVEAVEVEKED